MSVMDMNSRMAMAEKLSVQQLQQAIQSGSLPAYIGIPLIEQKNKERSQMAAAQGGQQKPPSVASQILQQSDQQEQQERGIDELPSNLPTEQDEAMGMANGGIVAFAGDKGSLVRSEPQYSSEPVDDPEYQKSIEVPKGALSGWFRSHMEKIRKQNEESAAARGQPITLPPVVVTPETAMAEPDSLAEIEDPRLAAGDVGIPGALRPNPRANPNAPAAGGTPTRPTAQAAQAAEPAQKSALDQYAEMLMAERGGDAKERQQAKGMALLQAGLGIAGGTSPNALANIAQGALPATQAYQSALSNIKKSDRDRIKQLMELGVSKEKLGLEAKKLGISEKRFDQMYELETQKLGVMGGSRADARTQAEELRRLSVAQGLFATLRKDQLMSGLSDEQLWSQAQRMAGQAGAAPVSSGSSVMGTYVPGKGYIPK
jgi:hypothetical protein